MDEVSIVATAGAKIVSNLVSQSHVNRSREFALSRTMRSKMSRL